jgi:hypothetical protein
MLGCVVFAFEPAKIVEVFVERGHGAAAVRTRGERRAG